MSQRETQVHAAVQPDEFARSPLAVGAGRLWQLGTQARFLDEIAAGRLPRAAFDRWLAQDYLFVGGLLRFAALAVARIPRRQQGPVLAGLVGLDQELTWFEQQGRARGVDLNVAPHPVCRAYVDFLMRVGHTQSPEVLLSCFYGVEVSYLVAWSRLAPEGPYAEYIARWSHADFRGYVRDLLRLTPQQPTADCPEHFDQVLRYEAAFWNMTVEA